MNILAKAADMMGGGIFTSIVDAAKTYFPPTMTDKERGDAELALMVAAADNELKLAGVMRDIQEMYETRIREMEGTAADLKGVPLVGPLIIFLRGAQRPLWGYGVLFMDWMVFSGEWKIIDDTRQDTAFLIINLLVLIFLFGERAFKNVAPLIERLLRK